MSTWQRIMVGMPPEHLLRTAMYHAASGMSDMVGQPIDVDIPSIKRVALGEIIHINQDPEAQVVGIYLLIQGDLGGQAVLLCPYKDALHLVDLIMGLPAGTTQELGSLERSALAEAGNMTLSFFLNAMSTVTGLALRPSPPAVIVDMMGAILDVIVTPVAIENDEIMIVETVLSLEAMKKPRRKVTAHFWVLPSPETSLPPIQGNGVN